MKRLPAILSGKKGWVLITLVTAGLFWGIFRGEGFGPHRLFTDPAPRAGGDPVSRGAEGPPPPVTREWKLTPFWLPLEQKAGITLTRIIVALQLSPSFAPDPDESALVKLRGAVWEVLETGRAYPLSPAVRDQMQQTLAAKLNEEIFQGTLKGVRLEVVPLS